MIGVPENKPNPCPVEAREESEGRGVGRSGQWGYGEEAPRAHDQDEGSAASERRQQQKRLGRRNRLAKRDTPMVSLLEQGRDPPLLQTRDDGGRRREISKVEVG